MTPSEDCGWKPIDAFNSDKDYEKIRDWLASQVRDGLVSEERVRKRYSGVEWDERWFRCRNNREIWRLIAPDLPFKGIFEPV